jgi:DNA-binding protein H-NS
MKPAGRVIYCFGLSTLKGNIPMASLSELLAQKAAIEKQIADTQREERGAAIAKVKSLMAEYGLSLADLGTRAMPAPARAESKKVAAKYRNAATGDTWSGRGLKPNWLKAALASGRNLADFTL